MTEPTYTITLTESERIALARALGTLTTKLINAPLRGSTYIDASNGERCPMCGTSMKPEPGGKRCMACGEFVGDAKSGTQAARAVLSPPNPEHPAATQSNPASPIVLRDRWARDRSGNEVVPNPDECNSFEARVSKVDKIPAKAGKKEYFKITWEILNSKGFGDANFFDPQLSAAAATQIGKKTTLHTVRKGNYTNLVGIRA